MREILREIYNLALFAATVSYAMLAAWRFFIARTHQGAHHLAYPLAGMAAFTASGIAGMPMGVAFGELLRDIGWMAYCLWSTRSLDEDFGVRRTIVRFCLAIAIMALVRSALTVAILYGIADVDGSNELAVVGLAIRWTLAVSWVFFAHFLYRSTASATGSGFRVIVFTLGIMWAYDLNAFTLMLLGYPQAVDLAGLRGVVALLLVPVFALAARRKEHWKITLSRQATTQSLLFVAIGGYFVVISSATRAAMWAGGSTGDVLTILLGGLLTGALLALAFRPRLLAHFKTFVIKHLFEHRYDYRTEWLRFSATNSDRGASLLSTEERAIRSLADVTESQGGILLLTEPMNQLVLAGAWRLNLPDFAAMSKPFAPEWLAGLVESARILNLDQIRAAGKPLPADGDVPQWLVDEADLWIVVPLVRAQRVVGLIALGRPPIERELDWEDFDLLKVIAQQVAVHLTDAHAQSELEEARRFDEFNRRFAFIIHDLKNVVSQLSLVSSNAEEHGANPKFQASMIKTLANATGKMTTLLSRLSADRVASEPVFGIVDPGGLVQRLADERPAGTPIAVRISGQCAIWADEERLREALGHLLSNAIEASPAGSPVELSVSTAEGMAIVAIEDHGSGMSANFIRKELYKPFASTKPGGFGIGAAEARALVLAMGGELDVVSVEGEGTRFSAVFPLYQPSYANGA